MGKRPCTCGARKTREACACAHTLRNAGPGNKEALWLAYTLAQQAGELMYVMGELKTQQVARRWNVVLEHTRREMSK